MHGETVKMKLIS